MRMARNVANTNNKSKKFHMEPAVRFKKKAEEEHANMSRVSTFHEEIEIKEKTRDDIYYNTFLGKKLRI